MSYGDKCMVISQALKDVMELEQKIKRGEAILAYWRQWLIDYRKQHPKLEGDAKSDNPNVVKPNRMTGEELAYLRKRLELTQREMAFDLGISRQHLGRLENGKAPISKKIYQLAAYLLEQGNGNVSNPEKCCNETRIKPSSTEAKDTSHGLSGGPVKTRE
jgi:DNA-binding XRE family transcriptional regulator